MRGLGKFQIAQMKAGDPRVPRLFLALRQALDLLEEIAHHPHQVPAPAVTPSPVVRPSVKPLEDRPERLAYSIKDVRGLTGLSNATIYAQIKSGKLRSTIIGGRTLILTQDLHTWIDGWNRR